jgi:hypothetical protein
MAGRVLRLFAHFRELTAIMAHISDFMRHDQVVLRRLRFSGQSNKLSADRSKEA